jgi:integrase
MNSLITQTSITLTSPLPFNQNAAIVYIQALGGPQSSGGRTQLQALKVVSQVLGIDLEAIDWGSLRYQHTAMIRARVAAIYSPATANKILVALRQTLKRAWLLGQMSAEEYQRAIQLDPITGETVPAGRELSQDEIKAVIDACKADKNYRAGIRDAAMIALMYIALLRREEVAKLTLSNIDLETGKIVLVGKRRKQRTVYVSNGAQSALNDWIAIRGTDPGALFVSINKSMKLGNKHLTPQAVYHITTTRSLQAGIENNSPHNFRRTAISNLLDSHETDIVTIAKLAGHKNIQTTARYDRRPEEAKKKAASLLHLPY